MTRTRSHEWHVRLLVSGIRRSAVYRVIAESARAALSKATRHVAATETFFHASVERKAKNVDPASYARDCEIYLLPPLENPHDREDTREPFRADLARPADDRQQ